jgi:hypothetical protein
MGDPFGMCRVQRVGNLSSQLQRRIDLQGHPLRCSCGDALCRTRQGRGNLSRRSREPRPYAA